MGKWQSKEHRGHIFALQTGGYKHAQLSPHITFLVSAVVIVPRKQCPLKKVTTKLMKWKVEKHLV